MKKILLPLLSLVLVLFSCENEALEGEFLSLEGGSSSSLIGTWALVDFNNTISNTGEVSGTTINSNTTIDGMNPNYNMTFIPGSFSALGSYGYNVNSTVNGVNSTQDIFLTDVTGAGDYSVSGNTMTVDGSFFTLEYQGVDFSQAQGAQTINFSISEDGQTLAFTQESTETNTVSGGAITAVVSGTSVWSKTATTTASCDETIANTTVAENEYNNDTTNTVLCNAYKTALQSQISSCGDADGSIQAIIDELNCNSSDDSLLLKQMIWTELDGTSETEEFFYDGNNLTSVTVDGVLYNSYTYENDLLTKIETYDDNGAIVDYTIPEYDTNNQLIVYTVYINSDNQGIRFELTYNTDGTITEKKYLGDLNSQTNLTSETIVIIDNNQLLQENNDNGFSVTYAYDTSNGIFKNISNLQTLNLINVDFSGFIDSGQNNILSYTENDNGTVVVPEEYVYTYNSNNYPETSNDYYEGLLDTTREYIYE